MPGEPLSFWDYFRAAFHLKVPVPLLGNMPVNKLLLGGFAILGFGNPGFWLLGLGFEVGYLLWLAGSPRFQALVRGERLTRIKQNWMVREQDILDRLDKAARDRYLRLAESCRRILQTDDGGETARSLAGLKSEGLNQILLIYLRLLNLQNRIMETIAKTSRKELEADIQALTDRLSREPEGSPVHRSLQGTLEVQKARLENLIKSTENLKYTITELDRIEKQVSLIAEEVAVSKSPEQLSLTLDGVVKSVQGTTKWMADNPQLFETMDASSAPMDVLQPSPRAGAAAKQ